MHPDHIGAEAIFASLLYDICPPPLNMFNLITLSVFMADHVCLLQV